MNLGQVKEVLHRAQRIVHSIRPKDRESYVYEHRPDGTSVTWRFKNAVSPQEIIEDVQTAAILLWSLKDYLKIYLASKGKNPNSVEEFVDTVKHLPILSDIANTTKHGSLNRSRSGRYARLAGYTMSIGCGLIGTTATDEGADVEVTLADPTQVTYAIEIRDKDGGLVGDGLDILRGALDEWRVFISKQSEMSAILE